MIVKEGVHMSSNVPDVLYQNGQGGAKWLRSFGFEAESR